MLSHTLHPSIWRNRQPLRTLVVGAGGTGSKVVVGLKNIHQGLVALGYPGLEVVLADGDTVSESNLVRQSFYPSDVGLNKAEVLVNRLNLSCGLSWKAYPHEIDSSYGNGYDSPKLVIDCVDTRAARATIAGGLHRVVYHVSAGNLASTGQVVLGQPLGYCNRRKRERLRTAYELFPELCDVGVPEDDLPSCSTLEALTKQDLLVNDFAATIILNLLWQLLRHGTLTYHGRSTRSLAGVSGLSPSTRSSGDASAKLKRTIRACILAVEGLGFEPTARLGPIKLEREFM